MMVRVCLRWWVTLYGGVTTFTIVSKGPLTWSERLCDKSNVGYVMICLYHVRGEVFIEAHEG